MPNSAPPAHARPVAVPVTALVPAPVPGDPAEAGAEGKQQTLLEPEDWSGRVALLGAYRSGNVDSSLFQLTSPLSHPQNKRSSTLDLFVQDISPHENNQVLGRSAAPDGPPTELTSGMAARAWQ